MCLGVPAKIIEIDGNMGKVVMGGTTLKVSLDLIDNAVLNEYVLVHAGYAIQRVDQEEAQKTLELLKQLGMDEN